jgi:seryl-tRNA synthetase
MDDQITEYELNEFRNVVDKWLSIDDDIRRLEKASRELKAKKKELDKPITDFMNRYKIEDCNTGNGKLKCSTKQVKKPLTKKYLTDQLCNFLRNQKKGEELSKSIYENRESEERVHLRRTVKKNGVIDL